MDNLPADFKENDPRDEDLLNEEWLETKYEQFNDGDANVKEAIIAELKDKGFKEESQYLEEKDHEDGLNYLKDKDETL